MKNALKWITLAMLFSSAATFAKPPAKPAANLAYQNYTRGGELAAKKKWSEALEKFQAAIDLNPTYIDAYIEWARASVMAGHRREGLERLSAALLQARTNAERERLNRERDSLSDIFYTNDTFQRYQNGLNYLRLDNPGGAAESLEKALQTEPDNVAVLYAYGRALQADERRKEALGAFERAFALNEGNRDVRLDLAEALVAQNPERTIQLLQPVLEPLEERVAWLQTQALASMKKTKDAITFLHESFEKNPSWPMAPFYLGRLYSIESGGGWNARKYLMTFLKRTEKASEPEIAEPSSPEVRKLRAARAEAEAILTRVNRSLE